MSSFVHVDNKKRYFYPWSSSYTRIRILPGITGAILTTSKNAFN